ncbi:unnamed protein product [Urochloa decumbens]|uniref:Aminotransferase-like plant mobile domain-containing protein n=1 Tax=Urochloa decumbens TaxID=240449 RepID=A0ABC8XZV3_9POAL
MADGEEPLVQESAVPVVSAADPSPSSVRLAYTLLPGAEHGAHLPALPSPPRDPGPLLARGGGGALAEFRGWPGCSKLWRRWVSKLRRQHEALWRDLGILDAILASTYWVRRDEGALLQLAAFWSAATSTFVFPWSEATVTLQDVAALAGLPLAGGPVRAPVSWELEKEVGSLEAIRMVFNQSKSKKPTYGKWVKHFLERTPDGSRGDLVEHGAFLSMWLSRSVLPSQQMVVQAATFPIAVRLARGESVALAPAALAGIYNDLSALKRRLGLLKGKEPPFGVSSPMHILQLWVWERFPELRPKNARLRRAPDVSGVPRVVRWHDVRSVLDTRYVYRVLMSPKKFEWQPYGSSSVALQTETGGCWVRGQDITRSKALLSFARCVRPCELVGMKCIEKYHPHRVARQLGFDQDVPGNVVRVNSGWEKAWDSYNIEAKNLAFIVPNHKPGVTVKYAQWWEPYSSACATAVANAVNTRRLYVLVNPAKRKMEGLLAADSSKRIHVDTSIGIHQPAPDADEDLEDEIPLVERLNGIIKMVRKQHNSECLVKGSEQELIAESSNSFRPISAPVAAKRPILHEDCEQALADELTSSLSTVDGSSCGSVTKMALSKYLQQTEEEGLVISSDEKNSRPECGDFLFHNVVQDAVSSGSNEAITGPATKVDMLPPLEDILVISDCEVETGLNDRTRRQEPDVLAHAAPIQTYVGHSEGPTEQMQKCIIAGDNVHTEKIDPLHCNEKENEGVLVSNQELESVVENLSEANRKESGNSERSSSSMLVDGSSKLAGMEVCTKTLYYLSRFDRTEEAWEKDANNTGADYMPRRAVGTMEMIKMASAIRKAEIAELKKNIDRLKEEILALEAAES